MNPSPTSPETFSSDLQTDTETVTNVGQSTRDFLWRRHLAHSLITIVLPICVAFVIGIWYVSTPEQLGLHVLAVMLGIGLLFTALWSYIGVKTKMTTLFFTELAPLLGCTYSTTGEVPTDGYLFQFGDSKYLVNVLSGKHADTPFWIADYSYTIGSGKHRQTVEYTVAQLSYSGTLPHVYCRPSHTFDLESVTPPAPDTLTLLSLEGDFDSKFSVHVAQGQQTEALQILEPNVMAKLMDNFERYGFECVGSHIYFFTRNRMREDRESVTALYNSVTLFCDILTPELQSFLRDQSSP